MNKKAEELYQTMLTDMEYCRGKGFDRSAELECLFNSCNHYWAIVQKDISNYEFTTASDEIYFFKEIKPKFISEKIYIGFVNHAWLFQSHEHKPELLNKFWDNESQRLDKFIAANDDFYQYYLFWRTDQDAKWFTRYHACLKADLDLDARTTTEKDHLVSTLLALERYHKFVLIEQTLLLP